MKNKEYMEESSVFQAADVSSKQIFGNHTLCAQFLREYSGLSLFANVQPEDIEDVSERYHLFREVELNADTVKKVRVRNLSEGELQDIYVISLIEHKSAVDYDVTMQILKYMVCIWENYVKEMEEAELCRREMCSGKAGSDVSDETEPAGDGQKRSKPRKHRGINKRKNFRYPPIYPIVYYEGVGEWTAARNLKERILLGDLFQAYIPDITYKLVRTREYSNEELLSKDDAISLVMLLDRIQQAEDIHELSKVTTGHMKEIFQSASADVAAIITAIVMSLCARVNLPKEEADEIIKGMRGSNMGILFENMEKMDIQLERRRTEEQRQKTEEERRKTEEQRQKTEEEKRKTEEQKRKTEEQKRKTEEQKRKTEEQRQKAEEQKRKTEEQKRKTEEQKRKTEEQRQKAEEQKRKTEEQKRKTEEQRQRAEKAERDKQDLYRVLISTYRKQGMEQEHVKEQLITELKLEEKEIDKLIEMFWEK